MELGFSPAARATMNLAVASTVNHVASAAALSHQRQADQTATIFSRNDDGSWELEAG